MHHASGIMKNKSWIRDQGKQILDQGSGKVDLGSQIRENRSCIRDQGSGKTNLGSGIRGNILDQGIQILDQGSGKTNLGSGETSWIRGNILDQGSGNTDLGSQIRDNRPKNINHILYTSTMTKYMDYRSCLQSRLLQINCPLT